MTGLTQRDCLVKVLGALVALCALLGLAGCSSSGNLATATGQMSFGVQAAKMNLWREAQFRFERAVQIDPQDAMAYNNLAVAYEGMGEYDKARQAYLAALKIDRSNQYIQKNYSRFIEFYSKGEKKDDESDSKDAKDRPRKKSPEKGGKGGRS